MLYAIAMGQIINWQNLSIVILISLPDEKVVYLIKYIQHSEL